MFLAACLSSEPRDILFQAQQPGGTEDLYALRPRDVAIRRIVRADTFSSRSLAAWSPDGRAIAFTREFGDTAQLYVLDSLSGMPRRIADGSMGFIAFPDWSPDGTRLLFSAGSHEHYSVYLIRADGSGLRPILQDTLTYRSPSWSPSGARIRGLVIPERPLRDSGRHPVHRGTADRAGAGLRVRRFRAVVAPGR
jgi:Tol biopolymer transport system component